MRFMRKGKNKLYFCPAVASMSAPTVAEVTAGVNITPEIAEVNGFSFKNNSIDTPDMDSTFVAKISGEDAADDSNMTFYEQTEGNSDPIWAALAKGTSGFMVIFPHGHAGVSVAADDECEVWPVEVASRSRQYTGGNEAAKYLVDYVITGTPEDEAVVAA